MRYAIALVALLVAGCSAASPTPSATPSEPAAVTASPVALPAELMPGQDWVLVGGTVEPSAVGFEVTMRFDDGMAAGKGPVNRYNATIDLAAQSLTFGPVASTKMAGPEDAMKAEQAYFDALGRVASWEAGEVLTLSDTGGPLLVFAAPDSPDAFAVSLVGLPVKQAKAAVAEAGYTVRVVSVDGDSRPVTTDYRPDRINLTIVDGTVTKANAG